MSNVFIDKTKIDNLANAISAKSGESVPMTLTEMTQAVDGIETGGGGGGGITPSGNIDITSAGVTDVTNYATATVPSATYLLDLNANYYTDSGTRKWQIRPNIVTDPEDADVNKGWIDEGTFHGDYTVFNAIASGTTVTPTTSSQTIGGSNYMMESAVTVSAMPSGSVTAPSTISGTSATVSTGTNTLTLSKTISVTPNVTTSGYVSSGTAGNSNVSLTASVTTQAAQTIHPSTTQQTIASGRYLTGTQTIAPVTMTNLTADNIKSGVTVQIGDASDSDRVASVTGTYSGGGGSSKNVQVLQSTSRTNSSSLTKVLGDLTVSKTGTYDIYWSGGRTNTSTSYTWGTRLYVDGSGYGTENTTWSNNCQSNHLSNVSLTANQKLSVYARGRTGSYYTFAPMLTIVEA